MRRCEKPWQAWAWRPPDDAPAPEPAGTDRRHRPLLADFGGSDAVSVASDVGGVAGSGGPGPAGLRHAGRGGRAGRDHRIGGCAGPGDAARDAVHLRLSGRGRSALCRLQRPGVVCLRLRGPAADSGHLGAVGAAVALEDPEVDHAGLRPVVREDDGPGRGVGPGGRGQHLPGHDREPDRDPRLSRPADAVRAVPDDGGGSGDGRRIHHGGLCDHSLGAVAQRSGACAGGVNRVGPGRRGAGADPGSREAGRPGPGSRL